MLAQHFQQAKTNGMYAEKWPRDIDTQFCPTEQTIPLLAFSSLMFLHTQGSQWSSIAKWLKVALSRCVWESSWEYHPYSWQVEKVTWIGWLDSQQNWIDGLENSYTTSPSQNHPKHNALVAMIDVHCHIFITQKPLFTLYFTLTLILSMWGLMCKLKADICSPHGGSSG